MRTGASTGDHANAFEMRLASARSNSAASAITNGNNSVTETIVR